MKNIIKAILLIAIIFYIGGAFGFATFNISNWTEEGRQIIAGFFIGVAIVAAAMVGINEID